jgi:hypothetical protein
MTDPACGRAVEAAGRYLLAHQSEDGAWRDFLTEPGVADAWTTAYVGLSLLTLPEPARPAGWEPSLERSARWLETRRDRFDGWGYNARCPPDADSTAHAILFLRFCGLDVPLPAYARLLSFQRPDGGFATYLTAGAEDSWAVSHPCVTPVAVHALLTALAPEDPRLARSLAYIRSGQASGLWPSFWWSTPLYGTAVNLEAVTELELGYDEKSLADGLGAIDPATPFERALLARCWMLLEGRTEAASLPGSPVGSLVESLCREQSSDGAWRSEPMLRVTRRSCFAPWREADPGPLVADQHRLFTTATVLRSLTEWADRRRFHAQEP